MTLQNIGPTSETWTRHTGRWLWFAAYRIDIHDGQHVAVLSRWTLATAAPRQTMLSPQPTREQAVWAAEQLLTSMGYRREGSP